MISAAALGVAARARPPQKSLIVKSISCPTAETTGACDSKIARATASSLNAHKSSRLPPPRCHQNQIQPARDGKPVQQPLSPPQSPAAAPSPLHPAWRQDDLQPRIPPPHHMQHVADRRAGRATVTIADALRDNAAGGRLRSGANNPSALSCCLSFFKTPPATPRCPATPPPSRATDTGPRGS